MALGDFSIVYPGQADGPSAEYPQGNARNVSAPAAGDGTPLEEQWLTDIQGLLQALLLKSGIIPSGNPDTALISQYLQAMEALFMGGESSDGFPGVPAGNSLESTGNTRVYPIAATTETIRIPQSVTGSTALGYRREDATGSGGASEWLISWNTVATFLAVNATNLAAGGSWHTSVIQSGKIHLGFHDADSVIAAGARSYIIRADLTTGAIEAVTRIDPANITVNTSANVDLAMKGQVKECVFWDITSGGNLRMAFRTSNSTSTEKGISFVELESDYVTLVSEDIFFDYEAGFGMSLPSTKNVVYFTQDLSVFVAGESTDMLLIVPGKGVISINVPASFVSGGLLSDLLGTQFTSTDQIFNHIGGDAITGDTVEVRRHMTTVDTRTNGERGIDRSQVNRALIDRYFKDIVSAYSGVLL